MSETESDQAGAFFPANQEISSNPESPKIPPFTLIDLLTVIDKSEGDNGLEKLTNWKEAVNLAINFFNFNLEEVQNTEDSELVQSWIDYLKGFLTPEQVAEPVEPHVPETLTKFLEKLLIRQIFHRSS